LVNGAMGLSASEDHLARGKHPSAVQLVGRQHDGATIVHRAHDERVQRGPALGVETRMGFVEQQQARRPHKRNAQRQPPPLPGRQPTVHHPGERPEPDLSDHRVDRSRVGPRGSGREPQVLVHGQIVVARRLMPNESDEATVPPPINGEVEPENLPDARMQRDESREDSQQRRLPGAVPAREQHDFAGLDIEVDAGQGREPAQETHGRSETDDGLHSASGKQVP
jgi:hypothetical protein